MPHRVSPEAAAELDGIWYYIAKQSGSMDVADRWGRSLLAHAANQTLDNIARKTPELFVEFRSRRST